MRKKKWRRRKRRRSRCRCSRGGASGRLCSRVPRARWPPPPPLPPCLARNRPRQVRPTPCSCRRASLPAVGGTIAASLFGLRGAAAAESRMAPGAGSARADGTPLYPWGGGDTEGASGMSSTATTTATDAAATAAAAATTAATKAIATAATTAATNAIAATAAAARTTTTATTTSSSSSSSSSSSTSSRPSSSTTCAAGSGAGSGARIAALSSVKKPVPRGRMWATAATA